MLPDSLLEESGFFVSCALYSVSSSVLAVCRLRCRDRIDSIESRNRDRIDAHSTPNRRAKHAESTRQARRSTPNRRANRDVFGVVFGVGCVSSSVLAVCRLRCWLCVVFGVVFGVATDCDQSRQNRRAEARLSTTNRDRIDAPSTPNRRANRDRIDSIESRNRDRIERIGRPPSILSCLASGIRSSFSQFF